MSEELFKSQIEDLRQRKPDITFQTPTMICFREIEDLIAHMLQKRYKFYSIPAWRYYCREDGRTGITKPQNRLYYMVEVGTSPIWEEQEARRQHIKLVTGDVTDYSGHGSSDMELAEYFITKVLQLPIEERPLSYLFSGLEYELHKLTRYEKE